jgi:SAM domain (Sterile alpha motif)
MAMVSSPNNLVVPPSPTTRSTPSPSPTPSTFKGNVDLVQQWDEATVGDWLKSVNCGKYRQIFASNNINGDALLDCDQNILKEVGVNKVGDRIRIMVAIKSLRNHAFQLNKVLQRDTKANAGRTGRKQQSTQSYNTLQSSPLIHFSRHVTCTKFSIRLVEFTQLRFFILLLPTQTPQICSQYRWEWEYHASRQCPSNLRQIYRSGRRD